MNDPVEAVLRLLQDHGGDRYDGEAVTQLEHALQCATVVLGAGAQPAMIAAALLHDLGHLLHDEEQPATDRGHEILGARFLLPWFVPAVTEPIRLHVAAKRCLCAIEPAYFDSLTRASRQSLQLQGGPLAEAEAREFLRRPWAQQAMVLRRWDEAAKVEGAPTPDLAHFRPFLEASLRPLARR